MRITEILETGQIIIPLNSNSRDAAIEQLIDTMKLSKQKIVFNAVLEREEIMSTGIGKGVAIPHCKNDACPDFKISLGIAAHGIDFHAPDNQAVRLIFLLVGPENNPGMHIKYLSRISKLVNNEDIRKALIECSNAEAALDLIRQYENASLGA